jgi:cytoskeletal protein CcmA (bactofilin family)
MVWRKRRQQTTDSRAAVGGGVDTSPGGGAPPSEPVSRAAVGRGGGTQVGGAQVSSAQVGSAPQNLDSLSGGAEACNRDFSIPVSCPGSQRPYVIPRNYRISGLISSDRQVLVQGEFSDGVLKAPTVTVTPGGVVRGRIEATNVQVAGTVSADVVSRAAIEVSDRGRLAGHVQAPAIKVWPGAILDASKLSIG